MSTRGLLNALILIWAAVVLFIATPVFAEILTFQQGHNGYERAQDTPIRWAYTVNYGDKPGYARDHAADEGSFEMWSPNGGAATLLETGQFFQRALGSVGGGESTVEAGPTYRYSRFFIRFRDIFGTGANQISPDASVNSATLKLYNTEDLGAEVAAAGAFFGDTVILVGPGGVKTREPNIVSQPKLSAATVGMYPLLVSIKYGNNDGPANKGVVTARDKRRGKEKWSRDGFFCAPEPLNDPLADATDCGPAPLGNPYLAEGRQAEYDPNHPGAIEVFQDASEGFKEFDVTGLIDSIGGNGLYVIGISPPDLLPTMDTNYAQTYRSSEFGSTPQEIATRPMLVVELGDSMIPGDANGDGLVDVADLGVLGANFGSANAVSADGDFNGDNIVDVADLGILGANWTASQAVGNTSALVPEPTTLSLLAMSVLMVGHRRRC